MKITNTFFFVTLILLIFLSFFSRSIIFPSDILNNLPSFSQDNWNSPKNSLLADPVFQFEPWRYFAKESIRKGEFPLWNNLNGKGVPFFANPQTAVLYPLNLLYYLFPSYVALNLIPLLKIFLLFFFSFLYFRSLKYKVSTSIVGSTAVAFSAFPFLWLLWPHTNVFILFPFLLFLTEKLYSSKKQFWWNIAIVFSYFIGVLGGHPETLAQVCLIHSIYIIWRFNVRFSKIKYILLSILSGFLMGAIQIIPFLEYLSKSTILQERSVGDILFKLPLISFVFNLFPFWLGAPHKQFYKPITDLTNFQEVSGGYTGFIVFLFVVLGLRSFKKNTFVKFWVYIALFCWFFAYAVWPIPVISDLSRLNLSANHRLIGFVGFSIVVLFTHFFDNITIANKNIIPRFLLNSLSIGVGILFFIIIFFGILNSKTKADMFILFISKYLFFIGVTTELFFILLNRIHAKIIRRYFILLITILILSQTFFLFYDYNPVLPGSTYYPQIELIKKLKTFPVGTFLEVGNPSIPPDTNIIYNFESAQNNDSMAVAEYQNEFNKAFPVKNMWKNVDEVNYDSLKKFGIQYVISDYNINLGSTIIQPNYDVVTHPILPASPISFSFYTKDLNLKQIRLLTASFNRINSCSIFLSLRKTDSMQSLINEYIDCKNIRNFMYYTVSLKRQIKLEKGDYIITLASSNATDTNAIALKGKNITVPYLELLSEDNIDPIYQLLFKEKDIEVYRVPQSNDIDFSGSYQFVFQNSQEYIIKVSSQDDIPLIFKKTYFPGWEAYLDGNKIRLENSHPFLKVIVPKGTHVLRFSYKPLFFFFGGFISLMTFVLICLMSFRRAYKEKFLEQYLNRVRRCGKKFPWQTHAVVFASSFTLSTILFIIISFHISFHFSGSSTTAINWLTVHKYPKQQDLFFFVFGIVFIFCTTMIGWLIWLLKKT